MRDRRIDSRTAAGREYVEAVLAMRKILDGLRDCIAVEDEVELLYVQLDRLETAGAELLREPETASPMETRIRAQARDAVASLPLTDLCRDREMLGMFVAEVVRGILTASDARRSADRRKRQADGIAAARANGVRFGRQTTPLPSNFDEVRTAWRSGGCTLRDAAGLCGMTTSSFYRAVRRAEDAEPQSDRGERGRTEARMVP